MIMVSCTIGGLTDGEIYPEIAEEVSKWPAHKIDCAKRYAGSDFIRARWIEIEVASWSFTYNLPATPQELITQIQASIDGVPIKYRSQLFLNYDGEYYDSPSGPLEIKYSRWQNLAEVRAHIKNIDSYCDEREKSERENYKLLQAKFGGV